MCLGGLGKGLAVDGMDAVNTGGASTTGSLHFSWSRSMGGKVGRKGQVEKGAYGGNRLGEMRRVWVFWREELLNVFGYDSKLEGNEVPPVSSPESGEREVSPSLGSVLEQTELRRSDGLDVMNPLSSN